MQDFFVIFSLTSTKEKKIITVLRIINIPLNQSGNHTVPKFYNTSTMRCSGQVKSEN